MKKIIIVLIIIVGSISYASDSIDNDIRKWIKTNFPIENYSSSEQKFMYENEVESLIWLKNVAEDYEILKKVKKTYPVEEYGYSVQKLMYMNEESKVLLLGDCARKSVNKF